MTTLQRDARSLAGSTIANLIGSNRYSDIDIREHEFIAFVDSLPSDVQLSINWIEAWGWFWNGVPVHPNHPGRFPLGSQG